MNRTSFRSRGVAALATLGACVVALGPLSASALPGPEGRAPASTTTSSGTTSPCDRPGGGTAGCSGSAGSATTSTTSPRCGEYVVVRGDYLVGIAARLGVDVDALLAANGMTPASLLVPGQKLVVPQRPGGGCTGSPSGPALPPTL